MSAFVPMLTLISALHWAESNCGATSSNELQITRVCLNDVNRIVRDAGCEFEFSMDDRYNLEKSRAIAIIYLCHYGTRWKQTTGQEPTPRIYALLWRLGYRGTIAAESARDATKRATGRRYWARVKRRIEKLEREGKEAK